MKHLPLSEQISRVQKPRQKNLTNASLGPAQRSGEIPDKHGTMTQIINHYEENHFICKKKNIKVVAQVWILF